MATLNWPGFGITSISPRLDQPSQSNANQWTGTRTVISDPWHGKWSFKVSLATMQGDAAFQAARAFFTNLKGQINTFHLPAVEAPQNANTGVTLSANAAQGATSIALTGLTTALVAGNMVTLNGQLLSLTSVGSLSGSAQTVNFMPTLRAAATSTTAVQTAKPYALVFLSTSDFSWDIGQWRRYGLSFDCQEAVAETDGADPALDNWTGGIGSSGGGGGTSFSFPQLTSFISRSVLAAVTSPTDKQVAYLTEAGREGEFVFSTANLSAKVTADPSQGLAVAPSSDTTGASGAWVRKFSGDPHVNWWGAVGDYDGNADTGTDNQAAISAAMTAIQAYAPAEGDLGSVWFLGRSLSFRNGGRYYTSAPSGVGLNIASSIAYVDMTGAELIVPANTYGIIINADTTNAEASRASGPFPFFCVLDNPKVRGHGGTDLTKHGIWMRRTAFLINPQVRKVSGDLIRIGNNGSFTDGNQNGWSIDNAFGEFAGGGGIVARGTNANSGASRNHNIGHCGRFGIDDGSAIGNKWHGQVANCGILLAGINAIPAFVWWAGHNWAIVVGQEGNTTVTPSSARPDVWFDLGAAASGDPAIPTWTSGITMLAGGDYCAVNCGGLAKFDVPYQEGGYASAQLGNAGVMRDPIGSVVAIGGAVEYFDPGRHALLNRADYLVATTDPTGTSYARLGGKGAGGVNAFGGYVDKVGNNWTWQAIAGFLALNDGQTGQNVIAVSTPGDGINFGLSAEQNGVFFSQKFALGYSNSGRLVDMGSAAPTTGEHAQGEIVFNNTPASAGYIGWSCTVSGTPGTWKTFGLIS